MARIRECRTNVVDLPRGTVTFLLTDIEGSTPRWEREPAAMAAAIARHNALVAAALAEHGGVKPRDQGEGDSVLAAFSTAGAAVSCAFTLQRGLGSEVWPTTEPIRVRMALHTGEADEVADGNYQGVAVIRAARIRSLATGGQVLLSGSTWDVVRDRLPEGCSLVDLGSHRLKGLSHLERVAALQHPDLDAVEPHRIGSSTAAEAHLPSAVTSFIGRHDEVKQLAAFLEEARLVTVVGEGGAGKTRVAVEAARQTAEGFDGVWFVDLAPVRNDHEVARAAATLLGATPAGDQPVDTAVAEHLRETRALLVLDNAEHVIAGAASLASAVLATAPGARVLATSQRPLGISGEQLVRLGSLDAADAARLFVAHARAAAPHVELDSESDHVDVICDRLDNLPLAIELAAAHVRTMTVADLLRRLDDRLRLLHGGATERHRTLRAMLDWSHALLDEQDAVAFRRLGVFAGSSVSTPRRPSWPTTASTGWTCST